MRSNGHDTRDNFAAAVMAIPSLVSYYRLDEKAGTIAYDIKSGLNGTYTGSPLPVASLIKDGATGGATSLNGTSQYVTVASTASLRPTNVTMFGWFTTTSLAGADSWVGGCADTGFHGYYLETALGTVKASVKDGTATSVTVTGSACVVGQRYFVALTHDGATASLYHWGPGLNTILTNSSAAAFSLGYAGTEVFRIGQLDLNAARYFPGVIGEVAVCNKALPMSTLRHLYNVGMGG